MVFRPGAEARKTARNKEIVLDFFLAGLKVRVPVNVLVPPRAGLRSSERGTE